jgi:hypothetical protein
MFGHAFFSTLLRKRTWRYQEIEQEKFIMNAQINQLFLAAKLNLNFAIEKAVCIKKGQMGLSVNYENMQLAEKTMKDESPLYVKNIVLKGQMCQDMYDDHPGHTYFYSDSQEYVDTPAYCTLSKAMQLSLQMLADAQQESQTKDEYDGLFTPYSIVLLDQFGNTVQEYSQNYLGAGRYSEGWVENLTDQNEWSSLSEEAERLDAMSSFESGWDNFETARQLRNKAAEIRRRIEIAKSSLRVIL